MGGNEEKDKTKQGIVKSTTLVMIVLMLVKILGFVKQAFVAAYFGTGFELDLYNIADKFVRELGTVFFASLSVGFLTLYTDAKEKDGERGAHSYFLRTLSCFIPISVVLASLIYICAGPLTAVIAPGYEASDRLVLVGYIRRIVIVVISLCISNVCIAKLEADKIFVPGKIIGAIHSFSIIIACVSFGDCYGVESLLYAVIVYCIIENVFLLCLALKNNGDKIPMAEGVNFWNDERIKKLVVLSLPLFLSNAVLELNILVDQALGSMLFDGAISALSFSNVLFQTIHSILIGGACTVLLSFFSTFVSEEKYDNLLDSVKKGLGLMFMVCVYIVIVCISNAEAIIRVVYARGAFDDSSVKMTLYGFIGYIPGIIFLGIRDLLIRVHYAYKDTKNPAVNGIVGACLNVIASLLLFRLAGIFGIALADTISFFITMVISIFTVKKHLPELNVIRSINLIKITFAAVVCLAAGVFMNRVISDLSPLIQVILGVFVNGVVYLSVVRLLRCDAALVAENYIKSKLFHKK